MTADLFTWQLLSVYDSFSLYMTAALGAWQLLYVLLSMHGLACLISVRTNAFNIIDSFAGTVLCTDDYIVWLLFG